MPRLTYSLPKYRKHRASGQAVVTLGGRDFYLEPHGTKASAREYDRLIGEFIASGRSLSFAQPDVSETVVQLAADYLIHAKKYYGTGATSEYHRIKLVLRPLIDLYGRTSIVDFGPLQLKAVRESLVAKGTKRGGLNRGSNVYRVHGKPQIKPPAVPSE